MISQFFIMSHRGDTLTFRDFRGDVVRGTPEIFYRRIKSFNTAQPPPFFQVEGTHFLFITQNNLYFVCTTLENVSPTFIYELLNRIAMLCKDYCGILNEETVRLNFALIYELVDEILDCGYPQTLATESLTKCIYNKPLSAKKASSNFPRVSDIKIFSGSTSALGLSASRTTEPSTIHKGGNELYIDIHEKLTVLIASSGHVIRSEIDGVINVRSYLNDSSIVSLALNEGLQVKSGELDLANIHDAIPLVIDTCSLHECVKIDELEKSKCLIFTPPDGELAIMKYQINNAFELPIHVHSIIETKDMEVELRIKVTCKLPAKIGMTRVNIEIPVPQTTSNVSHKTSTGSSSVEYNTKKKSVLWNIKRMESNSAEQNLTLGIQLSHYNEAVRKELGPLKLNFECPMHLTSGLQVRNLKVIDPNLTYSAKKWIRYVTFSDSYLVRL